MFTGKCRTINQLLNYNPKKFYTKEEIELLILDYNSDDSIWKNRRKEIEKIIKPFLKRKAAHAHS
jgi:hypothetical protein